MFFKVGRGGRETKETNKQMTWLIYLRKYNKGSTKPGRQRGRCKGQSLCKGGDIYANKGWREAQNEVRQPEEILQGR